MFFASPIWLVLLAPWLGLAIWLLMGQLETQRVPFLQLWGRETTENRRPKRAWNRPPVGVSALLAALLFAIAGAAGLGIRHRENFAAVPRLQDVRIEYLAVRAAPTTQAMIRVRNQSDLATATLAVHAGGSTVSREIDLSGLEQTRNYFVDLPGAPSMIDAEVSAGDGRIDHRLESNRGVAWPIIEARGPLPQALSRMIEVYGRDRPHGEGSNHVVLAMTSDDIDADDRAAILMNPQSGNAPSGPITIQDGELTRDIDWNDLLSHARVASPPVGRWRSMVSVGGTNAFAWRDMPARQVWVGFTSDDLPHRTDFVILWSNIFSWLGEGSEGYSPVVNPVVEGISTLHPQVKFAKSITGALFLSALGLTMLSATAWKAPKIKHGNKLKC